MSEASSPTPNSSAREERLKRRSQIEQEAKRRSVGGSLVTDSPVGSQTSNINLENRDRLEKRRAAAGRTSGVGATAISGINASRRAPNSSNSLSSSTDRTSLSIAQAREQKLQAMGLGVQSNDSTVSGSNASDTLGSPSGTEETDEVITAEVTPAKPLPVSEDGLHLEATLVDEDADISEMKRAIEEENQRLKIALEQENMRLRQKMQADTEKLRNEMDQIRKSGTRSTEEPQPSKTRRNAIICIVILVILIGGGVGAYFATSKKGEVSSDGNNSNMTNAPGGLPTAVPTSLETSEAPSQVPPLFDPPSNDDCVAIANGQNLDEQGAALVRTFDVFFDVSLSVNSNLDPVLPELQERLQYKIMPELAGCRNDQVPNSNLRQRALQRNLFTILNARVDSVTTNGLSCHNSSPRPCRRVLAKLTLYLQGEERIVSLLAKMVQSFDGSNGNVDLVRKLGLSSPFLQIQMDAIESTNPTEQPTGAPTGRPSVSPTALPSPGPTPSPTRTPTSSETLPTPTPIVDEGDDLLNVTCYEEICEGVDACTNFDIDLYSVGCGSCMGNRSCLNAAADIGEGSCLNGACEGLSGWVDDSSCSGIGACVNLVDIDIRAESCNCEGCCHCLAEGDTLPAGSCNSIAPRRNLIDYSPFLNSSEPFTFCCLPPSNGNNGGGNGGGGGAE